KTLKENFHTPALRNTRTRLLTFRDTPARIAPNGINHANSRCTVVPRSKTLGEFPVTTRISFDNLPKPQKHAGQFLVSTTDRSRRYFLEVHIETASLVAIFFKIGGQEDYRLSGNYVIKHHRRIICNKQVRRQQEIINVGIMRGINDVRLTIRQVSCCVVMPAQDYPAIAPDDLKNTSRVDVTDPTVPPRVEVVITPSWCIEHNKVVWLKPKLVPNGQAPCYSIPSYQRVIPRVSNVEHLAGEAKSPREDLTRIIVLSQQIVPILSFSPHQLTVWQRQIGPRNVISDSLQWGSMPGLQINLPRALAKEEWEVIVVHQIT